MTLDAHHNIHIPPCTFHARPRRRFHKVGECAIIVHNAAILKAVDHVAGRHVIDIDQAGQLCPWSSLEGHAQTDQSVQHDAAGAPR